MDGLVLKYGCRIRYRDEIVESQAASGTSVSAVTGSEPVDVRAWLSLIDGVVFGTPGCPLVW